MFLELKIAEEDTVLLNIPDVAELPFIGIETDGVSWGCGFFLVTAKQAQEQ